MDSDKFDVLASQTRLSEQSIQMARDVLVNGLTAAQAGRNAGVSRQLAHQAAKRILLQLRRVENYPPDWITITATLPKQWAQLVRYIQCVEDEKTGIISKAQPKLPEFELTDIAEFSKLMESILAKWRKIG